MTNPSVPNVGKAVDIHAAEQAEAERQADEAAAKAHAEHPAVKGTAEYAYEASTYRHPEDVQSGIFEKQAEAQQR